MNGAIAQWFPQNSGTLNSLHSVYFTDNNTGYIVGDSGTILKTTNGGDQWVLLNSGTAQSLRSVNFITPDTGYAVGRGVILKTNDAGASWINQTPSGLSDWVWLNCVRFPVVDTGYIVGDTVYNQGWSTSGLILKTFNGGSTWTIDTIIQDSTYASLKSVHFLNGNVGFICGGISAGSFNYHGLILKTTNGGLDWSCYGVGPSIYSICFSNESTGFAVGHFNLSSYSQLFKTIDAGNTWEEAGDEFPFLWGEIFFSNMDTGVIVGVEGTNGNGSILKSNDGGATWSDSQFITTNYLFSTFFTDGLTGYVVGDSGTIIKTTNGGTTSVNELPHSKSAFEIYPNPAQKELNLEISEPSSFSRISIINIQGQTIQERTASSKHLLVDISSLRNGIYFVRLQNEQSIVVKKILKQ